MGVRRQRGFGSEHESEALPVTGPSDGVPLRKIIHVDMDCFFAAVELLDRPELVDRPVAVGGEPGARGVISTCNYAARAFGVHSAMASARAVQLCPELMILKPDFDRYRAVAGRLRNLYREYTPLVEPLSLDEAYLDVTGQPHCGGSASRMAREIRQRIRVQEGLTASAGVAPNKFLAKVASDWRKPDGQFVIPPSGVADFVRELSIDRIFGVGRVTACRLRAMGVERCGDLQAYREAQLVNLFGAFGRRLYQLCRGEDSRTVNPKRRRKSLSVERTFASDIADPILVSTRVAELHGELCQRLSGLAQDPARRIAGIFVKVKFDNFYQTTAQRVTTEPALTLFLELCREALARQPRAVRLLGVGVRFRDASGEKEPDCDDQPSLQRELFA